MSLFLNNLKDVVYNLTTGKYQYCLRGTYVNIPDQVSGGISILVGSGLLGGTITSTGTISMPNVGTAGTYGNLTQYPIVTTDAQGRVTNVTLQSIPTSTITLNGQTGNVQTFDNGFSGITPSFVSSSDIHTLNIPLANSSGVTSGTISNTDYQNFNNTWKLSGNTVSLGNFIGSTNSQDLKFKTNNIDRASITAAGIFTTVQNISVNGLDIGRYGGNVGMGLFNFPNLSTGVGNDAYGVFSLQYLTTGNYNSAFGHNSGNRISTGIANSCFGVESGFKITTGSYNTFVGLDAGQPASGNDFTGSYNTILGAYGNGFPTPTIVSTGLTSGSYNTIIGCNVTGLSFNTSNNIILADGQGNIRFRDDSVNTSLTSLSGVGTRMVVTDSAGVLSTQAIPVSGSLVNFADEEVPSGAMNSINPIFTLVNTPITGSLKLYLRGKRLLNGSDYTLSGLTITMIDIPDSGDSLIADYRY